MGATHAPRAALGGREPPPVSVPRRTCPALRLCAHRSRAATLDHVPRPIRPLGERLALGIDTSAGPDACHPWTGVRDDHGYGQIKVKRDGRWVTARLSRVVVEHGTGKPLAPDVLVRHTCDTPECANLRHLVAGTQVDNMADRQDHGAGYVSGEEHPNAVVSDATVAAIRAAYQPGVRGAGTPALARRFGLSRSQVQRIVTGASRAGS